MAAPYQSRKYSVFLSMTTKGNLEGVRQSLASHTVACGHIPITMELWPSSSQPVREVIRSALKGCDIYVVVIGPELGSICTEEGISYTELEYQEALRLKKPILAFVLNDTAHAEAIKELKSGRPKEAVLLDDFRKSVMSPEFRTPKPFSLMDIKDLEINYLIALQQEALSIREGGWVRESDVRSAIELNETIQNNQFFKTFVDRLETFPILSERTGDGKKEKEAIARFFWESYLARLAKWEMNRVYFESGSTLAYVGREFLGLLGKPFVRKYIDSTRTTVDNEFRIYTNNILIYVDVALAPFDSDPMRIKRLPVGPADPYYGAIFGELTSLIDIKAADFDGQLSKAAKQMVDQLSENVKYKMKTKGVILMAASGLDLTPDPILNGPHVGSYYNMLIKRSLLKTRLPTVLFLHSKKIEQGNFRPGHCFAICDQNMTGAWPEVTKKQPIAIVTSAETESKAKETVEKLRASGLHHIESNWSDLETVAPPGKGTEPPKIIVVIASNNRFRNLIVGS